MLCNVSGLPRPGRSLSVVNVATEEMDVGDRVLVAGQRKGVIRFSGETDFAPGQHHCMSHGRGNI